MNYYLYRGHTLCAREVLPYEKLSALPAAGEVIFLFARTPLMGRETFPVTDAALLTDREVWKRWTPSPLRRRSRRSLRQPSATAV